MSDIGKLYADCRDAGWIVNAYTVNRGNGVEWRAFARPTAKDHKFKGEFPYPGSWGSTEVEALTLLLSEIRDINYDVNLLLWDGLIFVLQENIDVRSRR